MVPVGPQVAKRGLDGIQIVEGEEATLREMYRARVPVEIWSDRGHFENRGEGLVHGDVIREPLLEAARVFDDRHHSIENGASGGALRVSLQDARHVARRVGQGDGSTHDAAAAVAASPVRKWAVVGGLGVARGNVGGIAKAPVAELASTLIVGAGRVVLRLAVQEIRGCNVPATRGRIASPGRPARDRDTDGRGRGGSARLRAQEVEVGVATRGDILGLEIAVDDGHLEARFRCIGCARRRGQLRLSGTGEPSLLFAVRRAAITAHLVAVVAFFTRINVSVAAGCGAGLVLARAVATIGLLGAGLRAAGSIPVEKPILGAGVAHLTRLQHAVAAVVAAGRTCRRRGTARTTRSSRATGAAGATSVCAATGAARAARTETPFQAPPLVALAQHLSGAAVLPNIWDDSKAIGSCLARIPTFTAGPQSRAAQRKAVGAACAAPAETSRTATASAPAARESAGADAAACDQCTSEVDRSAGVCSTACGCCAARRASAAA